MSITVELERWDAAIVIAALREARSQVEGGHDLMFAYSEEFYDFADEQLSPSDFTCIIERLRQAFCPTPEFDALDARQAQIGEPPPPLRLIDLREAQQQRWDEVPMLSASGETARFTAEDDEWLPLRAEPRFACGRHGATTSAIYIYDDSRPPGDTRKVYCALCLGEWMDRHWGQMTEVEI